jgi:antitoxin PrlF
MSKGKSDHVGSKKAVRTATREAVVPAQSYKGKVTTAGTSEGFRFDKSLFKQHPEFKQKAEVVASIIGPGTMLVSLVNSPDLEEAEDPVVSAFLAFLEQDMLENQTVIEPVSAKQIARAKALTAKMTVTDDDLD